MRYSIRAYMLAVGYAAVARADRRGPGAVLSAWEVTDMCPRRRAFTLVELLVVITIILLISAVALPTVLPAMRHRQVSEAARQLQGL